jgi:hypothetical protein
LHLIDIFGGDFHFSIFCPIGDRRIGDWFSPSVKIPTMGLLPKMVRGLPLESVVSKVGKGAARVIDNRLKGSAGSSRPVLITCEV